MPEPVITTASRICWPLTVGVLVDGIEVACAPNYESARACAAELRAQPEMLVEHHYRFGGWSAASETQGWQGDVAVDLTYAEQHDAEKLALREHGVKR